MGSEGRKSYRKKKRVRYTFSLLPQVREGKRMKFLSQQLAFFFLVNYSKSKHECGERQVNFASAWNTAKNIELFVSWERMSFRGNLAVFIQVDFSRKTANILFKFDGRRALISCKAISSTTTGFFCLRFTADIISHLDVT